GRPVLLIDELTPSRIAFITRLGEAIIPNSHTVLQEGDLVHVMVSDSDLERTQQILSQTPEAERS
ncbi:MAG: TrkA family potassium uptake protein, partial [Actinobacteria bacterium]|nr:TrkA family potassium uptake protein [Actinomycetota bacterium]